MSKNETTSSTDDAKCIVLWMVNRAIWPEPARNHMLPAGDPDEQEVWIALDFSRRKVFDSFEQAVELKKRIISQYGDEVVAIVADGPQWADQTARDRYLPHWAWVAKYGKQA